MKKNFNLLWALIVSYLWGINLVNGQTASLLGGEISYECIGVNTYQVSLNVYADCSGADLPDSISLNWSGACQGLNAGVLLMPKAAGSPVDVTSSIFGGASGSSCNGGTGTRGVEHYSYIDTLVIPATCSMINLSWQSCCRSDSLTSINDPDTTLFYLETEIKNFSIPCNTSPFFMNPPIIGACANWSSTYNQGAVDPDGDSLRFSLIPCLQDSNQTVNYNSGYSGTAPLGATNPVSIDTQTGQINYTASIQQASMFCVLVEEVRNGLVIGSTIREIAIVSLNCSTNNIPIITGIDSTNNFDTTILVGQTLCFDIHGEDLDTSQQLTMTWNNAIAGATFTIDTTNNPIGTFCWTPTVQDTGVHTFWVEVNDHAMPVPGVEVKGFTIQVNTTVGTDAIKTSSKNTFNVYPNPASNTIQITFDFPSNRETLKWKIVDTQGKVVKEETTIGKGNLTVDVQSLATGLYSIIATNNQGVFYEEKLIVR
ncbi:T9SS type A sorting domain-containing protein [Aureispira sp. CCB-E]|uniref:T9SS type A sorting domain-containing protein n=1 Tax=Aureispira sp. CCB-E TaxID=3051121 RepID=UPI002868947B|nr:T9SS type A sorting domain-containing protein [Aureispira sp. CCB-E]WMX12628.1 T9SS type A sorting domain-containing protein [Aureispira sp. CCB-E]